MNRIKISVLLGVVVIALLGGFAFAINNNNTDPKKTANVSKTEAKQEVAMTTPQVEGASTDTPSAAPVAVAPTPVPSAKQASPVKKSKAGVKPATAKAAVVTTQTTTPVVTPVVPVAPVETPNNGGDTVITPPVEIAFDPTTDVIQVPVGGNSDSYTITADNAQNLLWWAFNEGVGTSDDEAAVKPGFQMFIVVEGVSDPNTSYISPTITFHIHARSTATVGLSYDADPNMQLGLTAVDPTTFNPVFSVPLHVTVTN